MQNQTFARKNETSRLEIELLDRKRTKNGRAWGGITQT